MSILEHKIDKLFEAVDIHTVMNQLKMIGYDVSQKSSNKLNVLTDQDRTVTINRILKELDGATLDRSLTTLSSLGAIRYGDVIIVVKPKGKQGIKSAGVGNEHVLVNAINSAIKNGVDTVIFESEHNPIKLSGVTVAEAMGLKTSGRKKADLVILHAGGKFNVSVKQDNAQIWESADSYWSQKAEQYIEKLASQGKVKLEKSDVGYYTITPNFAVEATEEEKIAVVFGSDILGHGCVMTRTFSDKDFTISGNKMFIAVTDIIQNVQDVPENKVPWFLVRNDRTRRAIKKYPGIRALAVYADRINKNVLRVPA